MVILLDHDKIAAAIERRERQAGVPVGSWRRLEFRTWMAAIAFGLRRNVALRERAARLGCS